MLKKDISFLLERGVAEVIVREELERLLREGKPLRLKMGFDPSRPDIHLGHAVGLRKLRQFQELGHRVILIVGDWTAQIGDPSGQSATRPMLSAEEVKANAQTYLDQFFKVVDRDRTEVRWQSEWFGSFDLGDVIKLTSRFPVAQLLARDDFSKRYAAQKPIAITEFLYPLLQAYDSIMIEADVEFGGTDQKFNLLLGRELQGMMGQRPQQCLLVPILVGTDGSKRMSKSLDNYIGIDEPPRDVYFKVMRLKDDLMLDYFELATDLPEEELKGLRQALADRSVNPMDIKKRLAREIVAQFHGPEAAMKAESEFERVVQRRESPDQLIELQLASIPVSPRTTEPNLQASLPQLFVQVGAVSSASEGRRLIDGGGVEVNGVRVDSYTVPLGRLAPDTLIKAGKRHVIKIVDADVAEPGK
ncbi:MAG: tyrosine--tRNA ligase [Dehalococcoidia bacterium]